MQPGKIQTGKNFLQPGNKLSPEIQKQPEKIGNRAGFRQPGRVLSEGAGEGGMEKFFSEKFEC